MPIERDAVAGEFSGSKHLGLAKLLTQVARFERVVSYAYAKRCHSWCLLEVRIPVPGEIADRSSEFCESC